MNEFAAPVGGWAGAQADVRAVGLVGSYARGTADPDSDIDLVVVVDDVGARLASREWLEDFGEVAHVEHEDWGLVQSLRVHYRHGPEVEFGLAPVEWSRPPVDAGTASVVRDGLRALFDPDRLLAELLETVSRP